jgi:hypothetical protein
LLDNWTEKLARPDEGGVVGEAAADAVTLASGTLGGEDGTAAIRRGGIT